MSNKVIIRRDSDNDLNIVAQQSNGPREANNNGPRGAESGGPREATHSPSPVMEDVVADAGRFAQLARDGSRDDRERPDRMGNAQKRRKPPDENEASLEQQQQATAAATATETQPNQLPLLQAQQQQMALDIIVGLGQASQHAQDSEATHQGVRQVTPSRVWERGRENRERRENRVGRSTGMSRRNLWGKR